MKNITLTFVLFLLTSPVGAQQSTITLETLYAPNEIIDNDFFAINLSLHDKSKDNANPGHLYAQVNYAGFTKPYGSQNQRLENIFVGIGAEYHARVSPYVEVGISADQFLLVVADIILDDVFDSNCREHNDCLSGNEGDVYAILGVRVFITRQITLGAFIESISFENSDLGLDSNTSFRVTGANIRISF